MTKYTFLNIEKEVLFSGTNLNRKEFYPYDRIAVGYAFTSNGIHYEVTGHAWRHETTNGKKIIGEYDRMRALDSIEHFITLGLKPIKGNENLKEVAA